MRHVFAIIAAALLAAPAIADNTDFENKILDLAGPCVTLPGGTAPSRTDSVCSDALQKMIGVYVNYGKMTQHEMTTYYNFTATAKMLIGTAYGQIDGARSERSCRLMESAWVDLQKVDSSRSPEVAEHVEATVNKGRTAVTLCRKSFEAPDGAPPA